MVEVKFNHEYIIILFVWVYVLHMSFSTGRSSRDSFLLPSSYHFYIEVSDTASESFSSDTATFTCSIDTVSITSESHFTNPESLSECSSLQNQVETAFVFVPQDERKFRL